MADTIAEMDTSNRENMNAENELPATRENGEDTSRGVNPNPSFLPRPSITHLLSGLPHLSAPSALPSPTKRKFVESPSKHGSTLQMSLSNAKPSASYGGNFLAGSIGTSHVLPLTTKSPSRRVSLSLADVVSTSSTTLDNSNKSLPPQNATRYVGTNASKDIENKVPLTSNKRARVGTTAAKSVAKVVTGTIPKQQPSTGKIGKPAISRTALVRKPPLRRLPLGVDSGPALTVTPTSGSSMDFSNCKAPSSATVAPAVAKKTTRKPWDTKGRLQDMETLMVHLEDTIKSSNKSTEELRLRYERAQLESHELQRLCDSLRAELMGSNQEREALSSELQQTRQKNMAVNQDFEGKIANLVSKHETELTSKKLELERLGHELNEALSELRVLRADRDSLREELTSTSSAMLDFERKGKTSALMLDATKSKLDAALLQLENDAKRIQLLEIEVREGETERRKLHNMIQELKGNIRVFCRVRPLLSKEKAQEDNTLPHVAFIENGTGMELIEKRDSADGQRTNAKVYPFQFDRIFAPDSSQLIVFNEISQLVQSALDGYNVCIFACTLTKN
jgi:kinesin family protein C1